VVVYAPPFIHTRALCVVCFNGAGVVDENGTALAPGLRLSCLASVPSLNIPASAVEVVVADGNGRAASNITLRVRVQVVCGCGHVPIMYQRIIWLYSAGLFFLTFLPLSPTL